MDMSSKNKFKEGLKVKPKLGILDALKNLGLDESLLVNNMVKGNIMMDAGRFLGIPENEIPNASLDETQLETLKNLIGKEGNYRTLDGVDMSGLKYYMAVAKNDKGEVKFSIKRSGRRDEGALRDTDIMQTHTYNKDGIEMEYSSAEYFSDESEYSRSAIASTMVTRRDDMITQTVRKTGDKDSKLFRTECNGKEQLMNGTVLIQEDRPEYLICNPSDYKGRIDYTTHTTHPYDRERILKALYTKTKFDFRNYPKMPKDIQQEMEKIEREIGNTGRE